MIRLLIVFALAATAPFVASEEGEALGWCGGAKDACQPIELDFTDPEVREILVDEGTESLGGSVSTTTDYSSKKTSVYTGDVSVKRGASFGRAGTTCTSSCTGNGCSINGCDASSFGCSMCSCFGNGCSKCTCTKKSTYIEMRSANDSDGKGVFAGGKGGVRRGI